MRRLQRILFTSLCLVVVLCGVAGETTSAVPSSYVYTQPGATATYIKNGAPQFLFQLNITGYDGTEVTEQHQDLSGGTSGGIYTDTILANTSTPFWLVEGAAVGSQIRDFQLEGAYLTIWRLGSFIDQETGQELIRVKAHYDPPVTGYTYDLWVDYDASSRLAVILIKEPSWLGDTSYVLQSTNVDMGLPSQLPAGQQTLLVLVVGIAVVVGLVTLVWVVRRRRRT